MFIPLLSALFQMCLVPLVYDIVRSKYKMKFEEQLSEDKPLHPVAFFLCTFEPSERIGMFSGIGSIVMFVVLLVVKLMNPLALPWWPVFLPLFLFGIYRIFSPYLDVSGTIGSYIYTCLLFLQLIDSLQIGF